MTTIYEGAAADGMNEKGLVANLLYLAESKYPRRSADDKRPTLPNSAWVQYVLDNYATTAEAVEGLRKEEFRIVPIVAPTGEPGTVHFSISDASGDSAIFEFIDGKLTIHHGKQYQVMTNSPTFERATSSRRLLESDRRLDDAAGYQSRHGSLRTPLVLCQRSHADRRPAPCGCNGLQPHAQCQRSDRHQDSGTDRTSPTRCG